MRMNRKIGRNEPCPCGSGKKYKRCHGAAAPSVPSTLSAEHLMETSRLMLNRVKANEKQREQQQGFGKPIISAELNGTRLVAVGKTLLQSNRWKTVHDFLGDYLRSVLGQEWGNAELAKPLDQRHPILVWYHHLCLLQMEFIKEPGKVHSAPMTGAAEAWYQLAYDLYSLEHNAELQSKLIGRLKLRDPENFQGARYETYVAGTMIRAGFDIEFENEDDRRSSHVEFTATCRKSERKYSVEAKRRNIDGDTGRFRLGKLLQKALRKEANHPRIVFLGADFIDAADATGGGMPRLLKKALADLRRFEGRSHNGKPLPPAYLFITSRPHDQDLDGIDIRSAVMAEGFQIPNFKMDAAFPSARAAHQSRKEHADMHQLLDSIRMHSQIPATFDGTAPELAFSGQEPRLIIGETYLVPDADGIERPGKLTTATVVEEQSLAFAAYLLDNGQSVIGSVPLSPEEIAAYRRHPDTFFGVEIPAPRRAETLMELFDFFMGGYRDTPKERLLELMAAHPDIAELTALSKADLTEIYAERCAWSALQQTTNAPPKPI